jgi:hypothetical protein
VTLIVRECCTNFPPLPPRRRRYERHVLDHNERRLASHRWTFDYDRVAHANMSIALVFAATCGDPNAVPLIEPSIINFPVVLP